VEVIVDLTRLWDIQVLVYTLLSTAVVVFVLIVLAIFQRRLRRVMSELESIRSELKLVEEGIETVTRSLEDRAR